MSHMLPQAQAVGIIQSKMVKKSDLPDDYSSLALKWMIQNRTNLLNNEFADFWIVEKNSGSSSSYKMYCGKNVLWNNTHYATPNKLPNLILIIENAEFKGILIGDVITELIQLGRYGIFLWISTSVISDPIPSSSVYIGVGGGALLQLPSGGTVQVIKHPNMIPPLMNISHFRVVRRF